MVSATSGLNSTSASQREAGIFFPVLLEAQRLLAAEDEQRVAGHGVERLDAAADQHRNAVEGGEVEIAGLDARGAPRGREPQQEDEQDEIGAETFHGADEDLLRRAKPVRWIVN
jgi:hypothetical protein